MSDDRERWNERYSDRSGADGAVETIPELERRVDTLPDGRALDVATGTGDNAIFLAERGYDVDAVDISDEAIETARERADRQGVDVNWVRADLADFDPGRRRYDLVTVRYFAALEYLPDLKAALAPDGVLMYEHHLRSSDPVAGPSSDRYRYRSNELLHACLDLTVLSYEERRRPLDDADGTDDEGAVAVATLVARRSSGGTQSYPKR
ncbi:class I SAM-dependent methyltransferase [Natrinema marinum]|uniref:class I SAM-dependent methyltransferase n=1 Tax=Natrinema marinum TaxID=2961598 RepID=UPI0020C916BC|nr:class I SAM-dependent methyltransferase [Natrinema marinum]